MAKHQNKYSTEGVSTKTVCTWRKRKKLLNSCILSQAKSLIPFYLAINYNHRPMVQIISIRGEYSSFPHENYGIKGQYSRSENEPQSVREKLHAQNCSMLVLPKPQFNSIWGHKNVESINKYAVASDDMQRNMCNIVTIQPHCSLRRYLQFRIQSLSSLPISLPLVHAPANNPVKYSKMLSLSTVTMCYWQWHRQKGSFSDFLYSYAFPIFLFIMK